MSPGGIIYIQCPMIVGSWIQAILRLLRQQFERFQCWYYWWERLMKYIVQMASGGMIYMCTKFHDERFRHLTNVKVIASTIWGASVLVLLVGGIYDVCRWEGLRWHIYIPNFVTMLKYWYYWWEGFMKYVLRWFHVAWYAYQDSWRWYRHSSTIKVLLQQLECLKYAVENGSGAMICTYEVT
jgi:hypothetical protein